jgi:hypothetical protein
VISVFVTSGTAITAIFSKGNLGFLNSQSPIALDIANVPSTRPAMTRRPAAFILLRSSYNSGLWSFDSGEALPFSQITDLASPALAQ